MSVIPQKKKIQMRALWDLRRSKIFGQRGRCFVSGAEDVPYADIPKPFRRKSKRKPYPTPMKELIRRAKEEKRARNADLCRILEPPENGLLVPGLVEVAHRVNRARESLLRGLSKLVGVVVPVKRCRYDNSISQFIHSCF